MIGPATHFMFGLLFGAAIAAVAVAFRRRWLVYLPPFVLACGLWAEAPILVGARDTTHWLANVFFGYAWLHPWLAAREFAGFVFAVALANLLLLGYAVFLARYFPTVDLIRWEQHGPELEGRGPKRRHSRRHRSEE